MVGTMAKIDDSVKKKVPELRFKGFTDDWEERKFADFIDVKSGKVWKRLQTSEFWINTCLWNWWIYAKCR